MRGAVTDIEELRGWIGRESSSGDRVSPRVIAALRDIVQAPGANVPSPPGNPLGLHWCLAPVEAPLGRLDSDGHVKRGEFLPPIPSPRRMWAGGDVEFHGDFIAERPVERRSRIADVALKAGRAGNMYLVSVQHEFWQGTDLVVGERQDIVYLESATGPTTARQLAEPEAVRSRWGILPSSVMLFRYSALTWNSHRIHFDADYARTEEHYPGLVVHGPLQASLILNRAAAVAGRRPRRFGFRARAPAFADQELFIGLGEMGDGTQRAWSLDGRDGVAMEATMTW